MYHLIFMLYNFIIITYVIIFIITNFSYYYSLCIFFLSQIINLVYDLFIKKYLITFSPLYLFRLLSQCLFCQHIVELHIQILASAH